MKIIATYNIKGGVGKTAAAVNLGYLAAADGLRVLIADLDPQAVGGSEVAEVHRGSGLADPALDVVGGDDLHEPAPATSARNRS